MSGYYVPYIEQINALSAVPLRITCVTHLGLSGGSRGVYTLQEEIQHKAAFLREHVLRADRPPCVLIGHSIGGHYQSTDCAHWAMQSSSRSAGSP